MISQRQFDAEANSLADHSFTAENRFFDNREFAECDVDLFSTAAFEANVEQSIASRLSLCERNRDLVRCRGLGEHHGGSNRRMPLPPSARLQSLSQRFTGAGVDAKGGENASDELGSCVVLMAPHVPI